MNTAQHLTAASAPRVADRTFRVDLRDRKPQALERFFDMYFNSIYRRVLGHVRNPQEAEDLTQDVFLKIQRSLPSFNPAKQLGPWIATILRNRINDHWRARGRERNNLSYDASDMLRASQAAPVPAPSQHQEQSESEQIVRDAIYDLPIGFRSVLMLRVYDGLSFDVIAKLLDLTVGTARKRYSRAIEALRASTSLAELHWGESLTDPSLPSPSAN